MIKFLYVFFYCIAISWIATAQVQKRRLPQNINVPTYSHIFPTLSGDGSQMIFLTNYSNTEGFETKYTTKSDGEPWSDPVPIPSINKPEQDHIGSFCLSYDGNLMVFSSRRNPGIGNFDIWISEKNGNYWSQPKNPGKPLNSPSNEGNPSLSPDGKSIYFMRCENMDIDQKRNCSLYVSHRVSATRWSEPEILPDDINTGHETTPRILSDNSTLVFASGRGGGKGKLDLYYTSLEQSSWSKPEPLSFINTDQNDEFISIPARGDIIYFSGANKDQYNIYKGIIPEEFRAKKVMMLTGTVDYTDDQRPSDDVLIQAFNISTGKVFTSTRLNKSDNSFSIFLPEGTQYDVSAYPQNGGHTYFSQIYDLNNMLISRKEEVAISLSALSQGISIPLNTIRFENYTSILSKDSDIAIKRIVGFLKKNSDVKIEVGAFVDQVYTDTIPSNDLTEVIVDTLFFEIQKENLLPESEAKDKEAASEMEELVATDTLEFVATDSVELVSEELEMTSETVVLSPKDSVIALGYTFYEETESIEVYRKLNYTYHNDRTQKLADALMQQLIDLGVPANLLEAKGYADDWEEDRAYEEKNYWIELKIFKN